VSGSWNRVLQRNGYPVADSGHFDPFSFLADKADSVGHSAKLSYGVKVGYGEVLVNVTLSCPQNEQDINLAGELAFRKAHELANDGASLLGLNPLPPIDE
jgi:hypothetical protein